MAHSIIVTDTRASCSCGWVRKGAGSDLLDQASTHVITSWQNPAAMHEPPSDATLDRNAADLAMTFPEVVS